MWKTTSHGVEKVFCVKDIIESGQLSRYCMGVNFEDRVYFDYLHRCMMIRLCPKVAGTHQLYFSFEKTHLASNVFNTPMFQVYIIHTPYTRGRENNIQMSFKLLGKKLGIVLGGIIKQPTHPFRTHLKHDKRMTLNWMGEPKKSCPNELKLLHQPTSAK